MAQQLDRKEAGTAETLRGLWPQLWDVSLEDKTGVMNRNSKSTQKLVPRQHRIEQGSECPGSRDQARSGGRPARLGVGAAGACVS